MYIVSKHFDFTDDELEVIYNSVVIDHENLEVRGSEQGITNDEQFEFELYLHESIIEKISGNGIFIPD